MTSHLSYSCVILDNLKETYSLKGYECYSDEHKLNNIFMQVKQFQFLYQFFFHFVCRKWIQNALSMRNVCLEFQLPHSLYKDVKTWNLNHFQCPGLFVKLSAARNIITIRGSKPGLKAEFQWAFFNLFTSASWLYAFSCFSLSVRRPFFNIPNYNLKFA